MKKLTIKQTKKIELEILYNFHTFCKENNLTYYLAYGTLLGAVRHKGFIPWDDDIDVYMPRTDYEKLLKLFYKININKELDLISFYNLPNYYLTFAKLVNTKTFIKHNSINYKLGVFIDIFPLDKLSNSYNKAFFLWRMVRLLRIIKDSKLYVYNKITLRNIIHKFIKVVFFFIPIKYLVVKINNLSQKYKNIKNSRYIGHVADAQVEIYENDWFKEKILLDFEEYKFWAPKEYDKILRVYFGNYMKLPPENKRIPHFLEAYWED